MPPVYGRDISACEMLPGSTAETHLVPVNSRFILGDETRVLTVSANRRDASEGLLERGKDRALRGCVEALQLTRSRQVVAAEGRVRPRSQSRQGIVDLRLHALVDYEQGQEDEEECGSRGRDDRDHTCRDFASEAGMDRRKPLRDVPNTPASVRANPPKTRASTSSIT